MTLLLLLLLLCLADVEVIDFFEFRKEAKMRAAWKPALIAFLASMNAIKHLKTNILVDPYKEYVDNLLNTLLTHVNEAQVGDGYDSCSDDDVKYLRHGSEYLELIKDIAVPLKANKTKSVPFLSTTGETNRPCCREVVDIIAAFRKLHGQMNDVLLVIRTSFIFRLSMHVIRTPYSAYRLTFQQLNRFDKPAKSGTRVTTQLQLIRSTMTTKIRAFIGCLFH